MQRAAFSFSSKLKTFLVIHVLLLNSNVFLMRYGFSSWIKSLRRSISTVKVGGNCHRIAPNFSLSNKALEKKASIGSAQSLSFLTCVINLLPFSEKVKFSGVDKYHFENASLSGSL